VIDGRMNDDRPYLRLEDGALGWQRCARCGAPLHDEPSKRRGFDAACAKWARAHPTAARRARTEAIAHDRRLQQGGRGDTLDRVGRG
jgi:hypothetical protein